MGPLVTLVPYCSVSSVSPLIPSSYASQVLLLGSNTWAAYDIDVGDTMPVKLPTYRVNPVRQKAMEEEVNYMLDHDLIKRGPSEWSSPVALQPKPDGKVHFCVDLRKVNVLSKAGIYPLPRVDDSVDKIGAATYITKVNLVKGYWQVSLGES